MKSANYIDVREKMQAGDVIAFGGVGAFSTAIKAVTLCPVSHVGIILKTNVPALDGVYINQIIESASIKKGKAGVQINRMSLHIESYDGDIWWLPLHSGARARLNEKVFFEFLLNQEGKAYDLPQAIGSAVDIIPDNKEDLDKLFCSELVSAGLEKAGVIGSINASEQTPADVVGFGIYGKPVQIKGNPKEIF